MTFDLCTKSPSRKALRIYISFSNAWLCLFPRILFVWVSHLSSHFHLLLPFFSFCLLETFNTIIYQNFAKRKVDLSYEHFTTTHQNQWYTESEECNLVSPRQIKSLGGRAKQKKKAWGMVVRGRGREIGNSEENEDWPLDVHLRKTLRRVVGDSLRKVNQCFILSSSQHFIPELQIHRYFEIYTFLAILHITTTTNI